MSWPARSVAPVEHFYEGLNGEGAMKGAQGDLLARRETLELVRAYYRLGRAPRQRLLDLAKTLQAALDPAGPANRYPSGVTGRARARRGRVSGTKGLAAWKQWQGDIALLDRLADAARAASLPLVSQWRCREKKQARSGL